MAKEAFKLLNEKLLADFECVVCTEYMHPPIVQCIEGHSVCHKCHKKLGKCPTCRQQFDLVCRPLVLERLHSKILFPCKFTEKGCAEQRHGYEIQKHEIFCQFAPAPGETSLTFGGSSSLPEQRQVYHYLSMLEELADLYMD